MTIDPGLQFIGAVNNALSLLYTGAGFELELDTLVGSRNVGKFTRAPAVRWIMGKITHAPGDSSSAIVQEQQEYHVEVWGSDEATTRELKNNLIRCARSTRATTGAMVVEAGSFDWVREGTATSGSKLRGTLTSYIDVATKATVTTATIHHQVHAETLDAP